jgi:hypothetical protein
MVEKTAPRLTCRIKRAFREPGFAFIEAAGEASPSITQIISKDEPIMVKERKPNKLVYTFSPWNLRWRTEIRQSK